MNQGANLTCHLHPLGTLTSPQHIFFQYKGDDHNPYLQGLVSRCHKIVYVKHLVACLVEREHAVHVNYVHLISFWPQSNWGRHDAVLLGTETAKLGAFAQESV